MLSEFDRKLLNVVQQQIPLAMRPYAVIAERLDVNEEMVIERLHYLKSNGYIRRLGAFFNSDRLGYESTLVALAVETAMLPNVAATINELCGVTHNYEREGAFNLWFTLLSPDKTSQDKSLAEIAALPGVKRLLNLSAVKKFKVNVRFML